MWHALLCATSHAEVACVYAGDGRRSVMVNHTMDGGYVYRQRVGHNGEVLGVSIDHVGKAGRKCGLRLSRDVVCRMRKCCKAAWHYRSPAKLP